MNKESKKYSGTKQIRRKNRARAKINGDQVCPRISVFRSNKYIFAQAIDDKAGKTIFSVSDKELKTTGDKTTKANALGKLLAEKCVKNNISCAVFDRNGYKFHGRVKAFAEGARAGGLKF